MGLYAAGFANGSVIGPSLLIRDYIAILAAISAAFSAVAYLWMPKKLLNITAFVVYLSLAVTTGALLHDGGVTTSPFIALAILILVFSGVFGLMGLGIFAVIVNGYLAFELLVFQQNLTSFGQVIIYLLAYESPLIASWIIWHRKSNHENEQEKAYSELVQQLSKVSNKSEIVINAIADGVIAVDHDGTIQLINPAAQQIIGWESGDAVGLDFKSVLKLESSDGTPLTETNHPLEKTLRTNEPTRRNDLTLVTSSGKKLNVSVLTSAVGQPGSGAIVVFRDITKEKAEEREQFEFISTASHEMRTPVASIEGYLGLALNPNTAQIDEKARLYLQKAHESAQHLGRLFQDLLDVSRAEDGRLKNNPKVVDVVAFTQEIVAGFEVRAKEKGLILFFKPTEQSEVGDRKLSPVYYTEVDNDHLREVLSNLIDNAIKYTKAGDVTVDVKGDREHVTISISDTGIGIPSEDVPHLFQKFYRVDNSDTREIGGTGLGLYLSRRLVEAMNGRIWVESTIHEGSTFYVELPRLSHEEATAKIERSTEAAIKQERKQPVGTPPEMPAIPPPAPVPAPSQQPPAPVYPQVSSEAPTPPQAQAPVTPQPTPQVPQSTPVAAPQNFSQITPRDEVDATAQFQQQAPVAAAPAPQLAPSQPQSASPAAPATSPATETPSITPPPQTPPVPAVQQTAPIRHSLNIPRRHANRQK